MTVQADQADQVGEAVLYFVFFVVILGAAITYLQYLVPSRFAFFKEMPYVIVVFILGTIVIFFIVVFILT